MECGDWNTLAEDTVIPQKKRLTSHIKPIPLSKIVPKPPKRLSTMISEFDRVLGGGLVPGQVVLLAGAPGIGKSTLLTQLAKEALKTQIMYVCGEENPEQIKIRADRMTYKAKNLLLLPETNVNSISMTITDTKDIGLVIVDSIQTLFSEDFSGIPGSLSQVRGCTQILSNAAKKANIPVILVGHVTKEGVVAGPKVLEHIVDTVLYLEGDSQHMYRVLKTTKNRFGPISEVGIFEMEERGMIEIKNPSELFLSCTEKTPGSVVTVIMEGYRPILFEIQALTVRTSFGYPRRTASGFNTNRLQVLIAIIEKRTGIALANQDVYLSVAGGYKISEYSADLAVCLAIISSIKNKAVKKGTVAFGECGLGGEVRRVPYMENRSKEARKLGYTHIISPKKTNTLKEAVTNAGFK